jgi:hypothetical protein
MEFSAWPKTPRLFPRPDKPVVITEKIDGTNAAIVIEAHDWGFTRDPWNIAVTAFRDSAGLYELDEDRPTWADTPLSKVVAVVNLSSQEGSQTVVKQHWVGAQSRTRLITPGDDNHGFAQWVSENAATLVRDLGPGRHYGEWWGRGVNRNYGLDHRRFSLFNTEKWTARRPFFQTDQLDVVPVIEPYDWRDGQSTWTELARYAARELQQDGSRAAPGFSKPEGICVFHPHSRQVYKYTLDGDGHKG